MNSRQSPPSPLTKFRTAADRWNAVIRKDSSADGQFVYSVKTTRIYCRPSCPSRPALRKNVEFYSSCEKAEQAGFRPCKRCIPNGPSLAEQHASLVTKACHLIEASQDQP